MDQSCKPDPRTRVFDEIQRTADEAFQYYLKNYLVSKIHLVLPIGLDYTTSVPEIVMDPSEKSFVPLVLTVGCKSLKVRKTEVRLIQEITKPIVLAVKQMSKYRYIIRKHRPVEISLNLSNINLVKSSIIPLLEESIRVKLFYCQ